MTINCMQQGVLSEQALLQRPVMLAVHAMAIHFNMHAVTMLLSDQALLQQLWRENHRRHGCTTGRRRRERVPVALLMRSVTLLRASLLIQEKSVGVRIAVFS